MHAVVVLASVLVIVSIVWFVGVAFEFEYPHILETRRVRRGVTLDGRPAIAAIARVLGTSEDRVHIHICSYCRARLSAVPGTTYVQVSAQDDRTHAGYGFAYRRTTNQLVPADAAAVAKFNSLLPGGVVLHTATDTGSEPHLRVPDVWNSVR
jgi:hypothetical protein